MILPLEKQVSSLELSKRLKELGVPQESLFYWDSKENLVPGIKIDWSDGYDTERYTKEFSAFTVAELGNYFPWWIHSYREPDMGTPGKEPWVCTMENWYDGPNAFRELFPDPKVFTITHTRAATESDARAKMLIYLLEHKLITL